MLELIQQEETAPFIAVFQQTMECSRQEAKEIFAMLFVYVHGYASMYANNDMIFDEADVISKLIKVFYGAVYAAREIENEENI